MQNLKQLGVRSKVVVIDVEIRRSRKGKGFPGADGTNELNASVQSKNDRRTDLTLESKEPRYKSLPNSVAKFEEPLS